MLDMLGTTLLLDLFFLGDFVTDPTIPWDGFITIKVPADNPFVRSGLNSTPMTFPYNGGWETQPKSVGVYRAP